MKLTRRKRLAVWYAKQFHPELITRYTVELEGIYDLHMEQFLYSTTCPRRQGGPLGWTLSSHGYNIHEISSLRNHPVLHAHVDNGLLLVPITENSVRMRIIAINRFTVVTSELIERDSIPDFTNAVVFRLND